jgi:hypothetical protein
LGELKLDRAKIDIKPQMKKITESRLYLYIDVSLGSRAMGLVEEWSILHNAGLSNNLPLAAPTQSPIITWSLN